jgi:hypothetical protein
MAATLRPFISGKNTEDLTKLVNVFIALFSAVSALGLDMPQSEEASILAGNHDCRQPLHGSLFLYW